MNDLTVSEYHERAQGTAMYPRVYTEQQVVDIVKVILEPFIEEDDPSTLEFMLSRLENVLDFHETNFSRLVYPVLGLLGEAGEIANKLKKVARDESGYMSPDKRDALRAELGDVAWYVSATATGLRADLGEVCQENLDKLADRAARGVIAGDGDTR